jgi:dTDP-4-amino-4,6-dideoxygalactose transaminase
VNRIQVTRSSMPTLEEYIEEVAPLWESHWLTNMGVEHKKLEMALKERLGVENLALFTNGHNALECILEAMALPVGGEVITTPFTFASTTHAIVRKGLTPVFADVDPVNLTLDPESVERLVTPRTCAIVPVHVYGNLCDVDAMQEIADRHDLKVIYDAAHAFGVERECADGFWRSAAAFGDAAMFSFHATKVFNTIEGGCVCFRDESLYPLLNQWKNFGIMGPEDVEYVGGNAKMNEFCAAMGVCNLRHLDGEIEKRKVVAERYWERLEGAPGVTVFKLDEGIKHNYAYLPVLFDPGAFGATRDDVFDALDAVNVGARKYFYPLVSDFACYRSVYSSDRTPIAKKAASRVLTLPMYAGLALEDVDRICDVVLATKKRD